MTPSIQLIQLNYYHALGCFVKKKITAGVKSHAFKRTKELENTAGNVPSRFHNGSFGERALHFYETLFSDYVLIRNLMPGFYRRSDFGQEDIYLGSREIGEILLPFLSPRPLRDYRNTRGSRSDGNFPIPLFDKPPYGNESMPPPCVSMT